MKSKKPEQIRGVLGKVIKKIEGREPDKKERITDAWYKTVRNKAGKHTRPASIKKKTLVVEVDSSTWLYELNLRKTEIINNIQKELKDTEIENIRFKMGDIN